MIRQYNLSGASAGRRRPRSTLARSSAGTPGGSPTDTGKTPPVHAASRHRGLAPRSERGLVGETHPIVAVLDGVAVGGIHSGQTGQRIDGLGVIGMALHVSDRELVH